MSAMQISGELRDLIAASALSALLFAAGVLVPLIGAPAGFSNNELVVLSVTDVWVVTANKGHHRYKEN